MRFVTGAGDSIDADELIALVARSILPVRLDDRLAAVEAELVALRARVAELQVSDQPRPAKIH